MNCTFLLVGDTIEKGWTLALKQALSSLGNLEVMSEGELESSFLRNSYDVIVIDAGVVNEAALLASHLRSQYPGVPIVIATASPTWRRARKALRAGAADYIRKSLDRKKLRAEIEAVLNLSTLPRSC